MWPGYKTGDGIERDLWPQFPLLEEALTAAGVVVWLMVEFEVDDALAAAAVAAAADRRVEEVIICTDKDLGGQCVSGERIVQRIGGWPGLQPSILSHSTGEGGRLDRVICDRIIDHRVIEKKPK